MLDWNLRNLLEDLKAGRISRRQFITPLTRSGIPIGVVATLLASCSSKGSDEPKNTAPTDEGSPFVPKQRGGGGQLKLLWWQAPSILNGHMSNGTKDYDAASMFYEQLLYLDKDANFELRLATELPSIENGLLDPAGKWVVWRLKSGVTWHDGKPFTADDVVFTWQYASDSSTAAVTLGNYTRIRSVEKTGDFEVRVNFKEPTLDWSSPWNNINALIIPRHIFELYKGKEARNAPAN